MKLGANVRQFIFIILSILYMNHLAASFFYLQATFRDLPPLSFYWAKKLHYKTSFQRYLICYYWAFQTLLTIGYGDVVAGDAYEQLMAVIWMLMGIAFYSYAIGNMTQMI